MLGDLAGGSSAPSSSKPLGLGWLSRSSCFAGGGFGFTFFYFTFFYFGEIRLSWKMKARELLTSFQF